MTTPSTLLARAIVFTADPVPTPVPSYGGDPNLITPGVVGFLATFVIALVTVLLLVDMTRRMRRVRYRSEVREKLAAEQMEAELADLASGGTGTPSLPADAPLPDEGPHSDPKA